MPSFSGKSRATAEQQKKAGNVMLVFLVGAAVGAAVGAGIGFLVAGPPGAIAGACLGALGGVMVTPLVVEAGVQVYHYIKCEECRQERAAVAKEREAIAQKELDLARREAELAKGREELAKKQMEAIHGMVQMGLRYGASLEEVKAEIKKVYKDALFEEDIRDPETGELLSDCVRFNDRHYNRSTLVKIYKGELRPKNPLELKTDPSDTKKMPRDEALHSQIQALQRVGLSKALAFFSDQKSVKKEVALRAGEMVIKQVEERAFVAPGGYCSFFPPEKDPNPTPIVMNQAVQGLRIGGEG